MTPAQYAGRKVCGRQIPGPEDIRTPCQHGRETNLGTVDCYYEARAIGWEPLWYPGEVYLTPCRCNHEDDMIPCPFFKEDAE